MKLSEKMNYAEFKGTYPWSLKNYPGTYGLFNYAGIVERNQKFHKAGKKWVLVEEKMEPVSAEFYMNVVEAVPFFRKLGTERVTMGYTYAGYVPVEISSISPDKTEKVVRRYKFEPAEI